MNRDYTQFPLPVQNSCNFDLKQYYISGCTIEKLYGDFCLGKDKAMSRTYTTIMYITICTFAVMLTGCEPQSTGRPTAEPVSERQERLYAIENEELNKQIADLEKQFEKDLQAKQKELDKCIEEKSVFEKQLQEETTKMFEDSLINILIEELQKATEENTLLKAQIEDPNKKLEEK